MKRRKNIELDVDFIGDQKPLTKDEEKKFSEYFKQNKRKKMRLRSKRKVTV